MAQKRKINVTDRFFNGEIDMSLSDLEEFPIALIEPQLEKVTSLDLSNNRLTSLPSEFPSITFLTKLDLSKNELVELPENFGNLTRLKYLDLYRNKLEKLPLSFAQLTNLKFLDLKDNPLVSAIAKVAGPCVDNKGCQQCARDIVKFYQQLQTQVDTEVEMRQKSRQKQLAINQQKKQDEKKKLKKEKQKKAKKEAQEVLVQANEINKTNVKKPFSKKEQKAKKRQKLSTFWLIYRSIMITIYLLLVFLILLWFMFASKCCYTEVLGPKIEEYYSTFVDRLPPDYRPLGRTFGEKMVVVKEETGILFKGIAKAFNDSGVIQTVSKYVYGLEEHNSTIE